MRVLQLGPYPPPYGGVQTNLVAIRDHLRAHGHQAPVIHLTRHRGAEADEVFYPESAFQTARLLLRKPADILHLHIGGVLTGRLLGLCLFCSLLPGRETVLTFHSGGYPSSPEGRRVTRHGLTAFVLRRLDAAIAVNEEIAGFLCRCGVREVRVIVPAAGKEIAAALPAPLEAFYAAHTPVLLSVGLLEPEYDLPLQIAALGRFRESHPNGGLVIIGSGSLAAQLREQIAAQPWGSHILLAGDVPHAATLRAIRESSAVLRTTHYDGDSISVREALELGTPVIATDNGMRPPGCHLIGLPPALDAVIAAVAQALVRTRVEPVRADNTRNLDAVLELYEQVLKPGARPR